MTEIQIFLALLLAIVVFLAGVLWFIARRVG
jgi:hypothetical protein